MTRFSGRLLVLLALLGGTVTAQSGPAAIPQQLVFTPYHADGTYGLGETVGWTVTPGPTPPAYTFKWTIRRNNAVVLKEGSLDLSSGRATIEIAGDEPGMIYVAVQADGDLAPQAAAPVTTGPRFTGGNTGRNTGFYAVGAAVAPAKIPLSTPRPPDFDAFWDGKLAEQAKIPIAPILKPVETDVPGIEMNMFELDALGSKAHGYVAKPIGDGKFPAVIQLQYAGVYALNARAVARRAAEGWLILNVDSHDKLPSDPAGAVPRGYQAVGNTSRETSYFLNMYLRDSRVLDYLLTRPDWDGKTIVLMGGSMGGQQSLALAGLRPEKISAVLVCVPAGADSNGDLHGRKAGYPNWPSDKPDVMATALYFDTVNFTPRIKAPVMAGIGFIDTISPPAGIWTALNQIAGPVEALRLIDSEHDNLTPDKTRPCTTRTADILDVLVHGGTFKPAGAAAAAQNKTPDFRVQVWGDAGVEFAVRLQAYFDLRKELERGLPALRVTDSSKELLDREHALAERIRKARRGARQGDLFTPTVSAAVKERLKVHMNAGTCTALADDNPGPIEIRLNGTYPEHQPISTMAAEVLAALPRLAEDIEYRLLGDNLILLDTRARLVVDRMPSAILCPRHAF